MLWPLASTVCPKSVMVSLPEYLSKKNSSLPQPPDILSLPTPPFRVLGEHRYEIADPIIASEAGEQGDADVHHALGLRDHDGAPPEPGEPMPLAGVVPLDAVRLVLARIELSNRQEHAIDGVIVCTVKPRAPARQALEEALTGGFVTTPAFPVHQPP